MNLLQQHNIKHCLYLFQQVSKKCLQKFNTYKFNSKNLYDVLNVTRKADIFEIKQSYYALAKQFHPDVNKEPNANEIFSKICDAYEILSDQNKKKLYDAYSSIDNGDQEQPDEEIYKSNSKRSKNQQQQKHQQSKRDRQRFQEEVFQDFDMFFNSKIKQQARPPIKGQDIHKIINLSFMESIAYSPQVNLKYEKLITCNSCNGNKSDKGCVPQKCFSCGGSGQTLLKDRMEDYQQICLPCDGYGKIIKFKCKKCEGKGLTLSTIEETIDIPQNLDNNQVLRQEKSGNQGENGGAEGDLFIKVNIQKHDIFSREGPNIISEFPISITQSILGGVVQIPIVSGNVSVQLENRTKHNHKKTLTNMGIKLQNSRFKGDHVVIFKVKIPKNLSGEQKIIFQEIRELEKKYSINKP